MSMNKYMHPRNIYKIPPDFKDLAVKFPEFKKYVKLDITGKAVFDFKNPEALRSLSQTLLRKDFNLEVQLPENKLVPTVPLRLNYILWIEDLLASIGRNEDIRGIDIGTGASCIYSLMAAKKNKWSMMGTESDKSSIKFAIDNVKNNSLEHLINIVEITGETLLQGVINPGEQYDFCMCNPPFFNSIQELHPFFKSRKQNRPHPRNAFVANLNEVVSKGGEEEFIKKIIKESKNLGMSIKIYTTMIGQKKHLSALKKCLLDAGVRSFQETEFCQGNTTRWGLAWTFSNYDLQKVSNSKGLNTKFSRQAPPLVYKLPNQKNTIENLENISKRVLNLFNDLKMSVEDVTRNKSSHRFFVTAYSDTWSHQRRKRREMLREKVKNLNVCSPQSSSANNNLKDCIDEEPKTETSPGKRNFDHIGESIVKKLKISTDLEDEPYGTVFFKFMTAVSFKENEFLIELNLRDENYKREYLYQILQYIKNNFNKKFP